MGSCEQRPLAGGTAGDPTMLRRAAPKVPDLVSVGVETNTDVDVCREARTAAAAAPQARPVTETSTATHALPNNMLLGRCSHRPAAAAAAVAAAAATEVDCSTMALPDSETENCAVHTRARSSTILMDTAWHGAPVLVAAAPRLRSPHPPRRLCRSLGGIPRANTRIPRQNTQPGAAETLARRGDRHERRRLAPTPQGCSY